MPGVSSRLSSRPRRAAALGALLLAATPGIGRALTEQLMVAGMKTPTAFSVAVDAQGTVYTVDNKDPFAVRRVMPGGCEVVLAQTPRLDGGRGIAVGANGNVYVGASGSRNVLRIQPNGDVVELMTSPEFVALTGVLGAWSPLSLAVDADGSHLFVSEQNTANVVRIDTATGARTLAYPRPATATRPADPAPFHGRGIAVDAAGNLYVAGTQEREIVVKVPADGGAAVVLLEDDPAGVRLQEPFAIGVGVDGTVYVAAAKSSNVVKLAPGGQPVELLTLAGGLNTPRGLALGADETVYVASSEAPGALPNATDPYPVFRIPAGAGAERIDDAGNGSDLKKPKGIAVDHRGNVYVAGELSGELIRLATQPGTCGDGVVDAGEVCDWAAGTKDCCCTVDCVAHAAGALCASDGNECTDDVCDGALACTHPPNTRPCTDDRLFCNGGEVCREGVCTHLGDPCAADNPCANECRETGGGTGTCNLADGTPCPEDDNPCTRTECDGTGQCVGRADNPGAVCRAASGECDAAETCTGSSTKCPEDHVLVAKTCRSVARECDVEEQCDGMSKSCPPDRFRTPGESCSNGTCNAAGVCQFGGGGGGTCGNGTREDGEECDLGPLNSDDEHANSCCSTLCTRHGESFVCRDNDTVCQLPRTCAGSTDGTCPTEFDNQPNDLLCSPENADVASGCTLYRCNEGACAVPICAVRVKPVANEGGRLPRAFAVTCQQEGRARVGACRAVGYLDASAIVTRAGGRSARRPRSCAAVAARYAEGCRDQDPLYPYCRLVEQQLGKDGILTGRCRRIVDETPSHKTCLKWLRKLGSAQCVTPTPTGATTASLFRIETTLLDIVATTDQIPATTVITSCDRTQCANVP